MIKYISFLTLVFLILFVRLLNAQDREEAFFEDFGSNTWIGSYNKFRLSDKWFWRAEFHYRRGGYNDLKYVGRMSQIYNRHAINYFFSDRFNAALGIVVRLDFTPDPNNDQLEYVVPEPRIWHEYLWVIPTSRFQMFHRIRIEHRWSRRGNAPGSEWIFRNRWRYKYYMTIPMNKPQLVPGAIFFNPDVEIIMQSGRNVINSPLEDLRIYPSFGYIYNPNVTYTLGLMYTMGQRLFDGSVYRQRWVIRANAYVSLDFRKQEKRVPSVKLSD